jgi:hypothetical protein
MANKKTRDAKHIAGQMVSKCSSDLIQKAREFLAAAGLLQFAHRFGFDLADTLASHF